MEIARQFFGAGALQTGLISNPQVEEISDTAGLKQESGRPFDEDGVECLDEDDDEIEIDEGVL